MSNFNDGKQATGLQVFKFNQKNGTPIRVQVINKEPWFVASDVCNIIGIGNNRDAVSRLDEDEHNDGVCITDTVGRTNYATVVNESGLYHLIFQSRKPEAKKFRKWVTGDVLPTIRRTGRYGTKLHRSRQPRRISGKMQEYFDELTRWVTLDNEKEVASVMEMTRKHVHEVLRGRSQSVTILDILTGIAKENRTKGMKRIVVNGDRSERLEELRLEFMEESEEGGHE